MKVELHYNGIGSNGKREEWDFDIEAGTVYPGPISVGWIDINSFGSLRICLNGIPARIDLNSKGSLWLHDHRIATKIFKEPYHGLPDETSKVVYLNPDEELAAIV